MSPWWVPWLIPATEAVLVLGLLLAMAVDGWRWRRAWRREDARSAARHRQIAERIVAALRPVVFDDPTKGQEDS